jgi:pyrroloquinoline-quinone synthase
VTQPAPPSRASSVTARADKVLAEVDILGNPYLRALTGGSMPLEEFRASQEQFGFAVTYFARPMATLMSRIQDPADRLGILGNIVEEHGEFQPHAFHHATFRRFLASIGSTDVDRLDALTPGPQVHAFNSVLSSVCLLEDLAVGISCLGVIEHAFAGISAAIGAAVVERGWVARNELVHYALHAEIDERHAEDFFALLEPSYQEPGARRNIEAGLRLGAYVFNRFYADLYALGG